MLHIDEFLSLSQASDRRINSPELSHLYLQIDEYSKVVFLRRTEPTDTNRTRAEPEPPVMAHFRPPPSCKTTGCGGSHRTFSEHRHETQWRRAWAVKSAETVHNCPESGQENSDG